MTAAHETVGKISSPEELPDDIQCLKEMLWAIMQSNDELVQQNAWLKRQLWGKKSEKLVSPDQLALFEEAQKELESGDDTSTSDDDSTNDKPDRMPKERAKTRRGGKRRKKRGRFMGGSVPPDTPVQTHKIEVEGTCCVCGDPLCVLGTDTRRRLGFQPGHFYIQETVVQTGICPKHPHDSLYTPEGPDFIVPGGAFANDLATKIVVDKFADGLPLHRQAKRFERKGVRISTSTMSRNVIAYAALAQHIVGAMREELLVSDWLQGDATGLPIIVGNLGQTHPGQLWVYSNGETAVFEASMTKHGDIPRQFLDGYQGTWLCDGASNYNDVERLADVDRGGCWSHARRYVFEARNDHVAAYEGLGLIRELFMTERAAMLLDSEQRLTHRAEHAAPLVERIRTWLDQQLLSEHVKRRPKSPFAKAVRYLHNQWNRLILFLQCGAIPVHNNRSELLLRAPVVGRRAWQFAGSPEGADASATLFSITATCMLQSIDPNEYLDDVMPTLGSKTKAEIAELTPAKWAARKRLAAAAAAAVATAVAA